MIELTSTVTQGQDATQQAASQAAVQDGTAGSEQTGQSQDQQTVQAADADSVQSDDTVTGTTTSTGDTITVDVPARSIHLNISAEEFARRQAAWQPPPRRYERGYGWIFGQHILQAALRGCGAKVLASKMRKSAATLLLRPSS
mgnify:CR=1 FL=1